MTQEAISEQYRRFASQEARGNSPLYEEFACGVADDTQVLQFLLTLPLTKRQPNLVFASVRFAWGTPPEYSRFRDLVLEHADELRDVISSHSTQTNEPGRCAVLLPVLARLPQPLALLEPGCSAGLCLLLDRYAYDFSGRRLGDGEPVLPCRLDGPIPIPAHVPRVAWRVGIDVEPLDVNDPKTTSWLEALVWPGQLERLKRMQVALRVARRHPPTLVRGDALEHLTRVASHAPRDATLVILHSAFLPYLTEEQRASFVELVQGMDAVWVSNEGAGVLPRAPGAPEAPGAFIVCVNGTEVALADSHGAWMRWL